MVNHARTDAFRTAPVVRKKAPNPFNLYRRRDKLKAIMDHEYSVGHRIERQRPIRDKDLMNEPKLAPQAVMAVRSMKRLLEKHLQSLRIRFLS